MLRQVLEEIGNHYQINFMFDQKLVEQKLVNKTTLDFENLDI